MTGSSGLGTWVERTVAPILASAYIKFTYDREPNGSFELRKRKGSGRELKYPRKILIG